MHVELVMVTDEGRQQIVALQKSVNVFGRQTDCTVRIPRAGISRYHCEVSVTENGVSVRDLGSSNGTYVNQRRIQQSDVSAGDLIAIGDCVFVVRVDGMPDDIDAEDAYDEGVVLPASTQQAQAKAEAGPQAKPNSTPPAAPPARPAVGRAAGPSVPAAGKPSAAPANKPANSGDSSMADFDFLDEDDLKGQPKL
jgi:predicted component of type VI protein secretion system